MGRIKIDSSEYPTKVCLVCDHKENPKASIVDAGKAWLCPTCKTVLGRLVEESVTRGDGDD